MLTRKGVKVRQKALEFLHGVADGAVRPRQKFLDFSCPEDSPGATVTAIVKLLHYASYIAYGTVLQLHYVFVVSMASTCPTR